MKINRNKQIPNMIVYGALYAIIFGISIWLLAFHKESPTNWILYVAMIVAALVGLVKFALHSRKKQQQSA
jgi:DMSO reductase anchor subunit